VDVLTAAAPAGDPGPAGRPRLPGGRELAVAVGTALLDLLIFSDVVERVAIDGRAAITGTLEAGRVPAGGFRLLAVLPTALPRPVDPGAAAGRGAAR
jgi:hypothetical protein